MSQPNDSQQISSPLLKQHNKTLIAVIEMGQASWLVAGIVPGAGTSAVEKVFGLDEQASVCSSLASAGEYEAAQAGAGDQAALWVAYEAGRDGFWLARWLRRLVPRRLTSFIRRASPCPA